MSPLDVLKIEAAALRVHERSLGRPLAHSAALEKVARDHGFGSWRACVAILGRSDTEGSLAPEAEPPAMRRYKSETWGYSIEIPEGWDDYPPDPNNSPFEVTRFWYRVSGVHSLFVFKAPRDPSETMDVVLEGTEGTLAAHGLGNFSRGHLVVGQDLVGTLDFSGENDGVQWSHRQYFFTAGTTLYVLGFTTSDRKANVDLWDRCAASFEITSARDAVGRAPTENDGGARRRLNSGHPSIQPERAARPQQPIWTRLARMFVPFLALMLASVATVAWAQGIASSSEAHARTILDNPLGDRATGGGVGNPLGFKESTPEVVGLPDAPYDPAIEYANGLTDLEFGCYLHAREDFRHVLSVQPKHTRAWFLMGVAYNSTGDRGGAAGAYQKALNIDPQMIDAERELAVSLSLQGQADKAKALLDHLKTLTDACKGLCANAELLKMSVTRVEAALSGQLDEVMKPEPAAAVCSALSTTAARNCFAAAKFGDPHHNGLAACTAALSSSLPNEVKVRVLVDRGVVHLFDNHAKTAVEDFNSAIAMNAQVGDAYTNRGTAQLMMKQFEQARADLDRGLALGSSEPQRAWYNRALADEHLGETKTAYMDFMRAAMLDPTWEAPKTEMLRFKFETR